MHQLEEQPPSSHPTRPGSGDVDYNLNGNLTGDGTRTYTYNAANRLYRDGATGALLYYDPLGRLSNVIPADWSSYRISLYAGHQVIPADWSSYRISLYAGHQVIAEDGGWGTVLRRFVFGPGIDEPLVWYEGSGTSDRRWLHADERGSIVAVSNDSGNVTAVNRYDEYGVPQGTLTGPFGYTGQQWIPELGMYYYRARIYSPTLGRFMQTDPIGYGAGMNIYAYVLNDPVNLTDPSGLCAYTTWAHFVHVWNEKDDTHGRGKFTGTSVTNTSSCDSLGPGIDFGATLWAADSSGNSGTETGRVLKPNACVANFGGAAISSAGVRRYNLGAIEFRRGLDNEASEVTVFAYSLPTVAAVTQWNVIYVNPRAWQEYTNPNNSGFWEEIRHSVQFQNTWLFHAQYGISSAMAGLRGQDWYAANRFEREAKDWAQVTEASYRRTRPCS